MRTIPIHVDAARLGAINLGKQGESLACRVRFYAPKWYEEYPDAEYQLFVTPPGEATPYLADITQENGVVTWELTENDTTIPGSGSIELILTDGETKIKSVTYRTTLDKSPSSQEPGSAPDVHPTWWENAIKKIEAATEEAVNSIDGAMESEKQEATAAIAKAAEDAIASIPEDYTELAGEVSSLKDAKADAIWDESARSASHELHAQRGPMSVTLYGKTTETGTGDKSPDNPYTITGIETATVNAGGDEITPPLLPDGSPLHGNGTVDDEVVNDCASGCDVCVTFDGSEDEGWIAADASFRNRYRVALTSKSANKSPDAVAVAYTDRYIATSSGKTYGGTNGISMQTYNLFVRDDTITSLEDWIAYLAANPLTVYYRSTDYTPEKDLRVCRVVRKWGKIDSYAGETITTEYISSTGGLDEGAQIVYKLSAPETYMTDPLTLRKPDTLTTDTVTVTGSGETAVEYPHDTKHYIDTQIAAAVALALNG